LVSTLVGVMAVWFVGDACWGNYASVAWRRGVG